MFVAVFALAVVVGLLRGGGLRAFGEVRLRCLALLFVALGLRGALAWSGRYGWTFIAPVAPAVHVVSYALLVAALVANRRLPGVWFVVSGTLLNFAVVAANGARMPVAPGVMDPATRAAQIAFLTGHGDYIHTLAGAATRLPWLIDRFRLPGVHAPIVSIGDVFLMVGFFVLVQGIMLNRNTVAAASSI